MTIAAGRRLGPYEIIAPLGAGGMGEVYRARDARLGRDVAVKVLPSNVAAREDVRARFEREARAISALNHPNICTLYDVGRDGDVEYLVMELLEGETLAALLVRGRIAPERGMKIAIEIANALDRAHKAGIVHRDLKPGNVMITKSGAKLLDFGLARSAIRTTNHDATTIVGAQPITEEGMIVGTLEYMSPEQLEGKATDARTDIFSFGCIVYEMLTGRRAFSGGSAASLITAIMSSEPPAMSDLAPVTPMPLERLVRKCIEKNADDRWQSAGDLATELQWIAEGSGAVSSKRASRLPWWIAAVLAIGLAVALTLALRHRTTDARVLRAALPLTVDSLQNDILYQKIAVSPDGQYVVIAGTNKGKNALWLRSLSDGTVAMIPNSGNAVSPFWSPDSQQIGFAVNGKLVRVPRGGGDPTTICDVSPGVPLSATWSSNGTIVFAELNQARQLMRVPASGGTAQEVRHPNAAAVIGPRFRDASKLAYCTIMHGGDLRLHLLDLESLKDIDAGPIDSRPEFVGDTMLYVRAGTLLAQKVDDNLKRIGEPVNVAGGVEFFITLGAAIFSASENAIVFAGSATDAQITVLDRQGAVQRTLGPVGSRVGPHRSHDGKRLVAQIRNPEFGTNDLWVLDMQRNSSIQITATPLSEGAARWMADDKHVVYSWERDGPPHLFMTSANGGDPTEITPVGTTIEYVMDVTPDGKWILFSRSDAKTRRDLWRVEAKPHAQPEVLLATPFWEGRARVSPDGKWIAYDSNASGGFEIYVAPLDNPSDRVQVSSNGDAGAMAWTNDGREVVWLTESGGAYSATMTSTAPLDFAKPQLLFRTNGLDFDNFDISADGKELYVSRSTYGPLDQPLNLITNWRQLLEKR